MTWARAGEAAEKAETAAVHVIHGRFAWDADGPPILKDINLSIAKGQFIVIVGSVGSGKSSLLAALLNEMPQLSGSTSVQGSIAYTAQDPWIASGTVRANIVMSEPADESRYQDAIEACALADDLAVLPAGDQTEVGEKGVTLSGVRVLWKPPGMLPSCQAFVGMS